MTDIKKQTITFTRTVSYTKEFSFEDMKETLKDREYTENQLLSIWKVMLDETYEDEDNVDVEDDEFDTWFTDEIENVEDNADNDCRCNTCGECIDEKQHNCSHQKFCNCEEEEED